MKEFSTAVEAEIEEVEYEDAVKARTKELIDEGKEPEEAYRQAQAEVDDERGVIKFKIDDRTLRAFPLHEGQITFLMAATGRGKTDLQRGADITDLMLESLRDSDRDWFNSRLLTRDPKQRIPMKTIEAVFEYLVEEWFGRPIQPSSDSAR